MNLPAPALAEYQQAMHRAKTIRPCLDCIATREEGGTYCAICRGSCCACGADDITHPGRKLADGRREFWCEACDPEGAAEARAEEQRRRDVELTGEMPDRESEEF